MRDGAIYQMQEANARRVALLLGQFEFLSTREEAVTRVLRVSRWSDRLQWFFWPDRFLRVVDAVQHNLLAERQAKLKEAAAKPKIEVVKAL